MTLLRRAPAADSTTASVANWALTSALVVLLVVGLGAMGPLLRGSGWWFATAFVGTAVLCASAAIRHFRVSPSFVPVAALGVLLVLLTLLFGRGSGLFLLIPTGETLGIFGDQIQAGSISIQQQSSPAEAIEGIVFLLAAGAGLIAVAMDALAVTLRWPALAGLPVLIPVAVPGLIIEGGAEPIALVLTGAAYLLLLRVDVRLRRLAEASSPDRGRDAPRVVSSLQRSGPGPLWGSLAVGGIGMVSALVLSAATPEITPGALVGSGSSSRLFAAGVSPMVDLGQDLRRPDPGPALHYQTTATELPYFKLLTLDQFVGTTWTARVARSEVEEPRFNDQVGSLGAPQGLSEDVKTTSTKTDVVIDGVETTWLPIPTPATGIAGLDGTWYADQGLRAITSSDSTTRGQTYTVNALQLEPTAEQLRDSSTTYPEEVQTGLELPVPTPEIIGETARAVTADADSPYDAAVAIQKYLRGSDFSYDTEAPVREGFDGGGADVIATFLEVKTGYCVHFASAMAIMARTVDIPARLALGYLPGEKSDDSGDDERYDIDSHDLHSWPELYFTGIGWVPFEPTPGRGSVPDYSTPAAASASEVAPGAATSGTTPQSAADRLEEEAGTSSAAASQATGTESLLRAGLALTIVLAILLIPGIARRILRRVRIRRITSGQGGASEAWAELTDTALDHGIEVSDRETARSLAGRLAPLTAPADEPGHSATAALDRLLLAAERASYGRPGTGSHPDGQRELVADLELVLSALHSRAPRRVRLRSSLLPASLWPSALSWRNAEAA